ncbi:MAG: inositol-3-phosphate synthase, partial [Candidatus Aenigmarchaeota archaeon]|nr:inositol-3-phosphate synthase [Candidatus Aenigmarchaeota archaeon]
MGKEIKIAIAGIGNCCSSLIQGLFYYNQVDSNDELVPGLMHNVLGGYKISHIRPVAAFDIDARKISRDLSEAIFAKPNCTKVFQKDVPDLGVAVQKGPVLDGVADHMKHYAEDRAFKVSEEKPVDVAKALKEAEADMLVNYLPVGSEEAVQYYAQAALDAGVAFVNCMPVFIVSEPGWAAKFQKKGLPAVGDDIKAQVGATILHRTLAKLFADRGVKIERMYQINTGGNTDFLNMLERNRL